MAKTNKSYLLKRVKDIISGAEDRGYRWSAKYKLSLEQLTGEQLSSLKPSDIYAEATAVNPETGGIVSGTEYQHIEHHNRAVKAAETRRQKRINAQQKPANEGKTIFNNVYYDFISKLHQPIDETYIDPKGKTRPRWKAILTIIEGERDILLNLCASIAAQPNGEEMMGFRIQEAGEDFVDSLIVLLFRASTQAQAYEASRSIAEVIAGRPLTFEERMMYNEQMEQQAGYTDEEDEDEYI